MFGNLDKCSARREPYEQTKLLSDSSEERSNQSQNSSHILPINSLDQSYIIIAESNNTNGESNNINSYNNNHSYGSISQESLQRREITLIKVDWCHPSRFLSYFLMIVGLTAAVAGGVLGYRFNKGEYIPLGLVGFLLGILGFTISPILDQCNQESDKTIPSP